MTPDEALADLDAALAEDGEDIVLRRVTGTGANQVNADVTCRAFVRAFKPEQLVGGITQTDSNVIISPTEIIRAKWPGGRPVVSAPFKSDPRVPAADTNTKVIIQGKLRNLSFAKPFYLAGELVRIEMTVAG